MKSNSKKILILIVLAMSFVFLPNIMLDFDHGQKTNAINPKESGFYFETNINIDATATGIGAHNWTWAEEQPWCYGQGTWQEPYIIENVTVDCGGTGSGILIENSDTDYFIIRNCTVYDAGNGGYDAGIKLENTNNGILTNNNCSNNLKDGILLLNYCENNTISGNTAVNNECGIYFEAFCNNNTILGNTANDGLLGMFLSGSYYNNITGNTANNNTGWGIRLSTSLYNIITGNTANDNDGAIGIKLGSNSDNNTISGNTANKNAVGIQLDWISNNNIISGNTVCNNSGDGIYLENHCDNNTISGNTANDNDGSGISLSNCDYNNITGNTACNNETSSQNTGIRLYISNNNTISGNTACNNTYTGIFLTNNCDNNTISGNTANDNDHYGMYLDYCDRNTISGNLANGNGDDGIHLNGHCNYNTLSGNTLNDNDGSGIYIEGFNNNNTISGNTLSDNNYGMSIEINSNDNTIYGNFFLINGKHAVDNATDNKWNSTTIGNYWDNHTGPDIDSDGIVDIQYNVSGTAGSKDYLPIAEDGAPTITINSPDPGDVFGSTAPSFNVRITDDYLDEMWYSFDGGLHEYKFTENGTIEQSAWDALFNSIHHLAFYASDKPGNIGTADVIIIKDYTPPIININSPTYEEAFSNNAPSFNVNITEDFLVSMWYTIDGGLHNFTFTTNSTINQTAWDAMPDGAIILRFYAIDDFGYIGSAGVNIIKDKVAPVIIINSPAEGDRFGTNAPLFNITIIEDNLDAMWYSFDGGLTNYTIINNGTFNQTAWTALSQGNVTITFYARDLAGHETSVSVTVIKSVPSGLDPSVIITIVVISIVGGVALVVVVYVFIKKRGAPA